MKEYTYLDYAAGYFFIAVLILPLCYGLYLEFKREHEEGKRE